MKHRILLLTDYALRIPQRLRATESFNITDLATHLRSGGTDVVITHYEDPELFTMVSTLGVTHCLPATSFYLGYRHLVNSIVPVLECIGVRLIPSCVHLLAYENKTLQTALASALSLAMPETRAVATYEEFTRAAEVMGLPVVTKNPHGFASAGVRLITSQDELKQVGHEVFSERQVGTKGIGMLIVQKYLPQLKGDWKIIVLGNHAASLYRHVRPGDFRASGSGLFEFRRASDQVLDFAMSVKQKLSVPWVSCDIAETEDGPILIEFQVVHFGTTTIDKAPEHYLKLAAGWKTVAGVVPAESAMADAILESIATAKEHSE